MLVRTRHSERGLAGPALAAELRRRGIADDVARAAMEQVDAEAEATRALGLARKKLAGSRGLEREVRVRRAWSHLARKGYGPSTARRAVEQALAEDEEIADRAEPGD
jgi:regulatory protein